MEREEFCDLCEVWIQTNKLQNNKVALFKKDVRAKVQRRLKKHASYEVKKRTRVEQPTFDEKTWKSMHEYFKTRASDKRSPIFSLLGVAVFIALILLAIKILMDLP